MRDVVIVKLGGSLVTDKTRDAHARSEVIARLAAEIASALPDMRETLLLGHGSGSFGHVAAVRHGFAGHGFASRAEPSALGAARVQQAAGDLHRRMVDSLLENQVPAWSWAPSSALHARDGRLVGGAVGPIVTALEAGMVPVLFGDVVLDSACRASIASTEAVILFVAARLRRRGFRVTRVLWLGETDGVWDAKGNLMARIDAGTLPEARSAARGASGTDVTGGMLLRLDTAWKLARRGIPSSIFDGRQPGRLAAALRGEPVPGTAVVDTLVAGTSVAGA